MVAALGVWQEVTAEVGAGADFTRVHAVVEARSHPPPAWGRGRGGGEASSDHPDRFSMDVLERSLASVNLVAAREILRVLDVEGLDRERALAIINQSTGRSEATRAGAAGQVDGAALRLAAGLAERAGVWAPLTRLAAGGVGSG
jgi:hypothetical protein